MKKSIINRYAMGSDNMWNDCYREGNSWIIVGNTKIRDKYRILLTKMDVEGKILWNKTYGGGEDEYEGQVILKIDDRYFIGGNAHGIATPTGGKNWQAYILMVDNTGKKLKERSYRIGENDAIYDIIEKDGYLYCFGESSTNDKKYVFVMQINKNLDVVNIWKYGGYEDIFAGGFTPEFLAYSYRIRDRWLGKILKLDEEYRVIWEKKIDDILIYSLRDVKNHILLAGSKNNRAHVIKMVKRGEIKIEKSFGEGAFSNISVSNGCITLLGEVNEHPAVFILNEKFQIEDKDVEPSIQGWYENGCIIEKNKLLLLGYSSQSNEAIMLLAER